MRHGNGSGEHREEKHREGEGMHENGSIWMEVGGMRMGA